jgi:hypothetical protein
MSSMLVAIHKAMIELENTYYLPQAGYKLCLVSVFFKESIFLCNIKSFELTQ